MKRGPAASIALAALIGAQAADAQGTCPPNPNWSNARAMRFTVREVPGQRPVLLAEGAIDADLIPRLQAAIAAFQGDEIQLRSAGGEARTGNQAGLLIRQAGLATRITADSACAGACVFMFMGGVPRTVEPGGLFIAQPTTFSGGGPGEVAQASALLAAEDHEFLIRMGISRRFLADILYRLSPTPPGSGASTRRCLTAAELAEYNITTTSFPRRPPG